MLCVVLNHIYMCQVCAEGFSNLEYIQVVIDKNIPFSQNRPPFYILIETVFCYNIVKEMDQPLVFHLSFFFRN